MIPGKLSKMSLQSFYLPELRYGILSVDTTTFNKEEKEGLVFQMQQIFAHLQVN